MQSFKTTLFRLNLMVCVTLWVRARFYILQYGMNDSWGVQRPWLTFYFTKRKTFQIEHIIEVDPSAANEVTESGSSPLMMSIMRQYDTQIIDLVS